MPEPIRFKKYANRRLYNLSNSKFMVLSEIADIIRDGQTIKVIDAKTEEDVTAFILTQIILEKAKEKSTLLPVPFLHLIIQFGDNLLIDFFENHIQQIINNYIEYKNAMDAQFRNWLDMGKNFTETARQSMNPLGLFSSSLGGADNNKDDENKK